jgi:hypothetical protein
MKMRLFIIFVLIVGSALLLTWAVVAQAAPTTGTIQSVPFVDSADHIEPQTDRPDSVSLASSPAITFTPVATIYLPAVLNDFALCTAVPQLISPPDGSSLDTLAPLFQWDNGDSPNATELWVEIWLDPALTEWAYGLSGTYYPGIETWQISRNLDPATTHYWRAYFMCGSTEGPHSEVWSFTTGSGGTILPGPSVLSPANGSTLPGTTVTLQWSSVNGAIQYQAHYKTATRHTMRKTSDTQTVITGLSPNTTYEWWVEARNDYAWGNESAHWNFTTGASGSSISVSPSPSLVPQPRKHVVTEHDGTTIFFVEEE